MSAEAETDQFEARLALVCEDSADRQMVIRAALEQIGFAMLPPKGMEDAVERIRRDTYEIVIVDERYAGTSALDNPILKALRIMPMAQRRWMFVTLLGREFKTFDNAMAFARSVNVVVNLNDLPHLPAILKKGITEHVEFYRTFRMVLAEVGRR